MKILLNKNKLIKFIKNENNLGFVPTMGCIHKGHVSLIKKSTSQCDKTIVTIFINKPQFNKKNDSIYVTNLDGPLKHLENKWKFKEENKVTEVSFEVDFELKNDFLNIVMTKSFQFGLDKIADAFEERAKELFSDT